MIWNIKYVKTSDLLVAVTSLYVYVCVLILFSSLCPYRCLCGCVAKLAPPLLPYDWCCALYKDCLTHVRGDALWGSFCFAAISAVRQSAASLRVRGWELPRLRED